MRLFVPGVPDDEAEAAWARMRDVCGALGTRPLHSIGYEHNGTEAVVMVGEEGVVVFIFGGEAFYVFDESGERRSVPWDSVTEMAFFDGD
jgi:hypothetical protein